MSENHIESIEQEKPKPKYYTEKHKEYMRTYRKIMVLTVRHRKKQ